LKKTTFRTFRPEREYARSISTIINGNRPAGYGVHSVDQALQVYLFGQKKGRLP
jgi:hypothetical protein